MQGVQLGLTRHSCLLSALKMQIINPSTESHFVIQFDKPMSKRHLTQYTQAKQRVYISGDARLWWSLAQRERKKEGPPKEAELLENEQFSNDLHVQIMSKCLENSWVSMQSSMVHESLSENHHCNLIVNKSICDVLNICQN